MSHHHDLNSFTFGEHGNYDAKMVIQTNQTCHSSQLVQVSIKIQVFFFLSKSSQVPSQDPKIYFLPRLDLYS